MCPINSDEHDAEHGVRGRPGQMSIEQQGKDFSLLLSSVLFVRVFSVHFDL
jgi:hypothetical protein